MHVEWHGQSAFTLTASEATVFIDPFDDMGPAKRRGMRFEYPPIEVEGVDLVLVTHEHLDHNGVAAIVERLAPRWVVPMHYRTHRIDFLEDETEFTALIEWVERPETPDFNTADLPVNGGPIAVVPTAP